MSDALKACPTGCPMNGDPHGMIGQLIAKVDANTELTQCLSRKLDVHSEGHKSIDRHMEDVRRVLFEKDGMVDQVRDCKNFRAAAEKKGPIWSSWIASVSALIAAVAAVSVFFRK